jgi:peptidyl-prolyl cis-trans isomerase B (cyclophilin B)
MELLTVLVMMGLMVPLTAAVAQDAGPPPRVALDTSKGTIVIELAPAAAQLTTSKFLDSVRAGYYDGTVFHRVVPGFMIQGGGYDADLTLKPTDKALVNEADNGLLNVRGAVAMARKADPHSATTQFFVNLVDNPYLNHQSKSDAGWGYAVFGRVVEGMEVVDAIAGVETGTVAGMQNVPLEPVVVERATVVE